MTLFSKKISLPFKIILTEHIIQKVKRLNGEKKKFAVAVMLNIIHALVQIPRTF